MDREIRSLIDRWGATWGLPDLTAGISLTFSSRLTKSLGRCHPATGRVRLRADLQGARSHLLAEVLCHEVAHVAAFELFGSGAAPHGPEWRKLVRDAGFKPQVRATEPFSARTRAPALGRSPLYEHRCPVCQSVRYARRPVPRWRCAECLDAGLTGEFVITRHQRPESSP